MIAEWAAEFAVEFQIATGFPSSDPAERLLKASADVPGVDLDIQFEVPVFRVEAGRRTKHKRR